MVKSKADQKRYKQRDKGWEPSQYDLDAILNRLKVTQQDGISYLDRPRYLEICKEYREKYPQDGRDSINYKYFTMIKYLREIFTEHRMEFFKWISSPEWIHEVDYELDKFLSEGSLSDKYVSAAHNEQGGFFKFAEDAQIELVMMSRGVGKTTKWSCMRALWLSVKYPKYKWLIVHSDKDRAKGLIKQIKDMMSNKYLEMIFPDMFSEDASIFKARKGNIMTNEKIDIVTFNEETEELVDGKVNYEYRKEATFTVGAPGVDRTSWHFEGIIADDLVTDATSNNPENTRKIISYWRSLFAMQQYRVGWTFRCYMTGTHWWQENLYHEIMKMPNASVFICPGRWTHDGEEIRLCKFFDDKFFLNQQANLKEWYESQILMKPRQYLGYGMDLNFDKKRNVLEMTRAALEDLKEENMIVQVCDPSYSSKGKMAGDKKSRFTILHAVVDEDTFYIYSGWQAFGRDTEGIKAVNTEFAIKENIDFFIQDAQGTQGGFYDSQLLDMKKDMPSLMDFKHTKRIAGTKQATANDVLGEMFKTREIVLVKCIDETNVDRKKALKEIVTQITGVGGMDYVDCIVMMVSDIDRDYDVKVARLLKQRKKHSRNRKGNVIGFKRQQAFGRLA